MRWSDCADAQVFLRLCFCIYQNKEGPCSSLYFQLCGMATTILKIDTKDMTIDMTTDTMIGMTTDTMIGMTTDTMIGMMTDTMIGMMIDMTIAMTTEMVDTMTYLIGLINKLSKYEFTNIDHNKYPD